jgi:hypothetical protein
VQRVRQTLFADNAGVSYAIRWGGDPEDLTITFTGVVPVEELIAAFDEVRASPEFRTSLRMLHDHRLTDWAGITSDDIRRRADALRAHESPGERHRVAVVVPDAHAFGLMRMREAFNDGRMRSADWLFYDLESAREWLRGPG